MLVGPGQRSCLPCSIESLFAEAKQVMTTAVAFPQIHVQWATVAGEHAWRAGLAESHNLWHALQVSSSNPRRQAPLAHAEGF